MAYSVLLQGDVLVEENEDEEAAMPTESVSGFFVKHGTFMGTENDLTISQGSDAAASDSDYDTDLETEGERYFRFYLEIWSKQSANKLNCK